MNHAEIEKALDQPGFALDNLTAAERSLLVDTVHALINKAAPADPMDTKIPCDLVTGAVTIKKGCTFRTVQTRMNVLHKIAMEGLSIKPGNLQAIPQAEPKTTEDTTWAENGSVF